MFLSSKNKRANRFTAGDYLKPIEEEQEISNF